MVLLLKSLLNCK
uniref:Uncharacterized protein n=1 Tax=Rhizophora mucronata TaxID=61149 RepID=A0A2P2QE98_RHIMU